jgi:hypothetical protein
MATVYNGGPDTSFLLGKGLSEGIQQLANVKLQSMQRETTRKHITAAHPELPPEALNYILDQEPKKQAELLQEYEQGLNTWKANQQGAQQQQIQTQQQGNNVSDGEFDDQDLSQIAQYLDSPEAQQELTPEEIATGKQKLQARAQQAQVPQQEQAVPQQLPQKPSFGEAIGGRGAGKTAEGGRTEKQEAMAFKTQESIAPFLETEAKDYRANLAASKLAQKMLTNLQEHKKEWPGALVGNLPGPAQSLLVRNKHVREYVANANELVTLLAGTRKGVPTNFKIKLEQLSKADLGMPIGTQEEILKNIIAKKDEASDRQRFINSQKKNGEYPHDLPQMVAQFDLAQDEPLSHPQFYKDGTVIEEDDGKQYILKNGAWQEK